MKTLPKILVGMFLLLLALPVASRADHIDDFKAQASSHLPMGASQAVVRKFLNERNFYVDRPRAASEYKPGMSTYKEDSAGRAFTLQMVKKKGFFSETVVVTVFEFDDAGLLKAVRYTEE
jgi:hypothetical protein